MNRRTRWSVTLVVAAAMMVLALPTVASASDASIRRVYREQASEFQQDARTLSRASSAFAKDANDANATRLQNAAGALRIATREFRAAIRSQRASSATVKRGRALLVRSLSLYDKGLKRFNAALQAAKDGNKEETANGLRDAGRFLTAAGRLDAASARLIFSRSPQFTG